MYIIIFKSQQSQLDSHDKLTFPELQQNFKIVANDFTKGKMLLIIDILFSMSA